MNFTFLLARDYSEVLWVALPVYGLIAGTLIASFTRGKGFGMMGNMVVGIMGAVLGSYIYSLLDGRISLGLGTFTLDFSRLLIALVGALIFLVIVGFLAKRKKS